MSLSANVRAIEALEELRNALMRFKSDAQSVLDAVEAEIKRTTAWLQERLQYWQKELVRRQRILEEAQAALNSCMAKSYRDPETGRVYIPDCSREQAYVMQAKRLVQEAEQELRAVKEHIKRVGEAVASYQIPSRRLAGTLNGDLLKGAALLSKSATILHSYASSASGGVGGIYRGGVSAYTAADQGAFSVSDWTGYPSNATKPIGPFKVVQGVQYDLAREQGNVAIREYRNTHQQEVAGKQVHHIHPIKFGGDPSDPANLQILSPSDHAAITVWWNRVQRKLERGGGLL